MGRSSNLEKSSAMNSIHEDDVFEASYKNGGAIKQLPQIGNTSDRQLESKTSIPGVN